MGTDGFSTVGEGGFNAAFARLIKYISVNPVEEEELKYYLV